MNDSSAKVLVLGNSHTYFCVNPEYLSKKTINLANKSRKLATDYFILKKNIEKLAENSIIIIPISHYTLFTDELTKSEKRLYYNYYHERI